MKKEKHTSERIYVCIHTVSTKITRFPALESIAREIVAIQRGSNRQSSPPSYAQSSNISWACSRVISTSRGLEPSASETMPRRDISSMMRPARA